MTVQRNLTFFFLMFLVLPAFAEIAFEIFPLPGEGYDVKKDEIYYRTGNFGVSLKGGDQLTRSVYYAERGYSGKDPLRPLCEPDTTAILMTVFNRSTRDIQLHPQKIVLKVDDKIYPAAVLFNFSRMIRVLPQQIQRVLQLSVFYQEETVRAGAVVSKFLIYPDTPLQSRNIQMELDRQFFPGETITTIFRFVKAKVIRN